MRRRGLVHARCAYGHADFGRLFPCRCTLHAQTARLVAERDQLLHQLHGELGETLARCRLATFDRQPPYDRPFGACSVAEQQRQIQHAWAVACAYAEAPNGWLAFFGTVGTGKSQLAAAVAHELAMRGLATVYASVPAQLTFIKAGFEAGSSAPRLRTLREAPVLVLDDLGTENGTAWVRETLFEIINHRYTHALPTIITSNCARSELECRIADRIEELATIVTVSAWSYRGLLRRRREEGGTCAY